MGDRMFPTLRFLGSNTITFRVRGLVVARFKVDHSPFSPTRFQLVISNCHLDPCLDEETVAYDLIKPMLEMIIDQYQSWIQRDSSLRILVKATNWQMSQLQPIFEDEFQKLLAGRFFSDPRLNLMMHVEAPPAVDVKAIRME